jgi:hypothetical protein
MKKKPQELFPLARKALLRAGGKTHPSRAAA